MPPTLLVNSKTETTSQIGTKCAVGMNGLMNDELGIFAFI